MTADAIIGFVPLQRKRSRQKALGQNFLVDRKTAQRIVAAFDPQPTDSVLEIGPGPGILTEQLVEKVGRLVCVEIDPSLANDLRERWGKSPLFELVQADFLKLDLDTLPFEHGEPVRVISNLPYSVATAILRKLLLWSRVSDLVVMVQKEVADRIEAEPSTRERGFLSLACQLFSESIERVFNLDPGVFRPSPKVDSSVLRIRLHKQWAGGVPDPHSLLDLISAGFAHRRKTLYNNLRRVQPIDPQRWNELCASSHLTPKVRAEDLPLGSWISLRNALTRDLT